MTGKRLFLCAALLLPIAAVPVRLSADQSAMRFIHIIPGARAAALGESFTGISQGPEGMSFNPAGLAGESKKQISLQHVFFVNGILYDHLGYVHPNGSSGGWGAQLGFMNVKGMKRTVADASNADGFRETEDFTTNDFMAGLFYGKKIGANAGWGVGGKFLRESLADANSVGFAADFGVVYRDPHIPMTFGASFQNLGPKVKYSSDSFDLPRALRAGVCLTRTKSVPYKWVPEDSLIAIEAVRPLEGSDATVSGGIEVPFAQKTVAARAGYRHRLKSQSLGYAFSVPNGFSMGFGVNFSRWKADYAAGSFGDLGLTHRLSLTLEI